MYPNLSSSLPTSHAAAVTLHFLMTASLGDSEYSFIPTWHPSVPTRQPKYNRGEHRQQFIETGSWVMGAFGLSQARLWLSDGRDWSKEERDNHAIVAEPPWVPGRIIHPSVLPERPICPTSLRPTVWGHFFQRDHQLPFSSRSSSFLPMAKHQVNIRCSELLTGI